MTALETFTTASKQPLTTGQPSRHVRYLYSDLNADHPVRLN